MVLLHIAIKMTPYQRCKMTPSELSDFFGLELRTYSGLKLLVFGIDSSFSSQGFSL
jgi:hypothetical protein